MVGDGVSETAPAGRSWAPVNWTLLGLVVVALVVYVVVLAQGVKVIPGTSPAEHAEHGYQAVTAAANAEAAAFLTVDYKNMDKLQEKVLAGATGTFKQQYVATRTNLKTSAVTTKTVATPTIRQVAISKLSGGKATVFVAADLVRKNIDTAKSKATKACPHSGATCLYFRFKLGLTDTADGWKLSSVDFVS